MFKKALVFSFSALIAFLVLTVSVYRMTKIEYVFGKTPTLPAIARPNFNDNGVTYALPYPGEVGPDSPLWMFKALRDRILVATTINPSAKADLYLLMADKRLASAKILFDKGDPDLGVAVLSKAEKYLEMAHVEERIAHQGGASTSEFLRRYTLASLKHLEVISEVLTISPEDAKPIVIKIQNYPKNLYSEARNGLLEAGLVAPQNPYHEN